MTLPGAVGRILLVLVFVPLLGSPTVLARQGPDSLAPYFPTPQDVVNRMLDMAGVTKDDVVYDLGCGDGRIVITAAQRFGARGVGIDFDPRRIAEAKANARRAGVEDLVTFIEQDAMRADVSDATVVTLYLLSSSNMKLRVSDEFSQGICRPPVAARTSRRTEIISSEMSCPGV